MPKLQSPRNLYQVTMLLLAAAAGCSTAPLITQKQPLAINFALKRARFEMNCPQATATVLSSETIEPPITMNGAFVGVERAQYTVGVTGCGSRSTMVVVCSADNNGCFAAEGN